MSILNIHYELIVFDLELNQPTNTIIQIGATKLSRYLESFDECSRFDEFVHTKEVLGNSTCGGKSITELTGITQADVANAKPFKHVFEDFVQWAYLSSPNIVLACWGNDVRLLQEHYKQHVEHVVNKRFPFRAKFLDLRQVLLGACWAFYGKAPPKESLSSFMHFFGLTFEGQPHNALDDARNTARLFQHVLLTCREKFDILRQSFHNCKEPS